MARTDAPDAGPDAGYIDPSKLGIMVPADRVTGRANTGHVSTPDPNAPRPGDAGFVGMNLQGKPNTTHAMLRARMGPYEVGGERIADVLSPEELAQASGQQAPQPVAPPAPVTSKAKPSAFADVSLDMEAATRSG